MKVYSVQQNQNYQQSKKKTNPGFYGLKVPQGKSGFFLDYDDSLARKMSSDIHLNILNYKKKSNAEIIIVSGNSLEEYIGKIAKSDPKNKIPDAKYLISNDGQYIYENVNGTWVKDTEYEALVRRKSKYNSERVDETLKQISKTEFKLSPAQMEKMRMLENFEEIKASDPDFYNSAFSPYKWNPTEFSNKIFVSKDTNIQKLKKTIKDELAKQGIKVKFIKIDYPKDVMDRCPKSILLQSNQIRRKSDGSMSALFLYPMLKADGVEYLAKKLGIKHENMILAGDAENDASLVPLVKKGAKFICFENAQNVIKNLCNKLKQKHPDNIYYSDKEGAEGISESMRQIITV